MSDHSEATGTAGAETALVERLARDVSGAVEQVIVGKHEQVRLLLVALLAEGHVLIEDVPGVGQDARWCAPWPPRSVCASRASSSRPTCCPSDVTGVEVFDRRSSDFDFRPGPIFANVVLADEINRASPKTQSACSRPWRSARSRSRAPPIPLPRRSS